MNYRWKRAREELLAGIYSQTELPAILTRSKDQEPARWGVALRALGGDSLETLAAQLEVSVANVRGIVYAQMREIDAELWLRLGGAGAGYESIREAYLQRVLCLIRREGIGGKEPLGANPAGSEVREEGEESAMAGNITRYLEFQRKQSGTLPPSLAAQYLGISRQSLTHCKSKKWVECIEVAGTAHYGLDSLRRLKEFRTFRRSFGKG